MKSGAWFGWIAFAITGVSGLASVVFSFMLFATDFGLILAAIAAGKMHFQSALFTYGLWFVFHFGLHNYHLALLDTAYLTHTFFVSEFVVIHAIFVLGLLIGVASLKRGSSPQGTV